MSGLPRGVAARVAVMQQQNVASSEMSGQFSEHGVGVTAHGIEPASCPAGQLQIEARQHRIEKWIAQAGGRTEEPGREPVTAVILSWARPISFIRAPWTQE